MGGGKVTNLPLPRYVSLKATKGNVRRGPSLSHRIDWVMTRRNMPLKVVAEHGHWRKVEDIEGAGGWMHYALLSGARTVIVTQNVLEARDRPVPDAPLRAKFEKGVVASVDACTPAWCRIRAGRIRGWVRREGLWGLFAGEIID